MITFFRQPKAVFLLGFVQLWNRFSHYGMRSLLLVYMIKVLKMDEGAAIGIFAVYCALVELGGVFGAYIADKILGLRRSVIVGGWLIGVGHLLLAFEFPLLFALSFVILGSSLYTTNIATLVGNFYSQDDPRREQGFTVFYMSINIGAFLATLLCGFIGETYGWHWGFGIAAIGMVIANLSLFFFRSSLEGKGEGPKRGFSIAPLLFLALGVGFIGLHMHAISLLILPWLMCGALALIFISARKLFVPLLITWVTLVGFFIAEEQIGLSILLYSKGVTTLLAINPLVIMLGGPLAYRAQFWMSKIKSSFFRLFLPFGLASLAFAALVCFEGSLLLIGVVIGVISFAELFVGPLTYSQFSQYNDPKIMTLTPIGFSMAASMGGIYSQAFLGSFPMGFIFLSIGLFILGLGLAYKTPSLLKEKI